MVNELHEMDARIQRLSEAGRELIQDVHPQLGQIKQQVETVKEAISPANN